VTIAIAGNFTEGVVLGVDSAVTYMGGGNGVAKIYNGAQKLYHLGLARDWSDSPYAVVIFGAADFAGRPWRNLLADFWRHKVLPKKDGISEFRTAADLLNTLTEFLLVIEPDKQKRREAGLYVSGFGPDDVAVRSYELKTDTLATKEIPTGAIACDGMVPVVRHLLHGVDDRTANAIRATFGNLQVEVTQGQTKSKKRLDEAILEVLAGSVESRCIPDMDMPLRNAIDYVHFLVYSTVRHFKFASGAPVCGGDIELAAITMDRGFRRIRTKPLDSEID
jgi:hypothetical protein